MLRGFDTSHFNGPIDWASLEAMYGIDFGIVKATEAEGFVDSEFPANWAKLADVDLVRGAYHFARPDADPHDDVEVFLNLVDPSLPTDLLVLDLEASDLGQDATSAWAEEWAWHCRRLAPNYVPGVYMGSAYLSNRTGEGLRGPFGWLWFPRYPNGFVGKAEWPATFTPTLPDPNAWGRPPDFWQYTQSFPSIEGVLDADVYDGTLDQLRTLNQEAPVPLTPDDVTKVWSQDGIVKPPAELTTPDNPTWAAKTALNELLEGRANIEQTLAKLATGDDIAALRLAMGLVAEDVKALRALLPGE